MEFFKCSHEPRQCFVAGSVFALVFLNQMKGRERERQGEIDNELHNAPDLFSGLNPTELCRSTRGLLIENACYPASAIHVYQVISYLVMFLLMKCQLAFFPCAEKIKAENRTDCTNFTFK